MADVTGQDLAQYFEAREEQRQGEIADALPGFEQRMSEYLGIHRGDANLPRLLARMTREIAVQAYVRGWWNAGGKREDIPRDSEIFWNALHYVREFDDICPAWRVFDGRHDEEEDDA